MYPKNRSAFIRFLALTMATLLLVPTGRLLAGPDTSPPNVPDAREVISFLQQAIGWYRDFSLEQQLASEPRDVLFLNDNRQLADQVVRLSFDFARADAELLASTSGGSSQTQAQAQAPGKPRYQRLQDMAARADSQVKQSRDDLQALKRRLESATGRQRRVLQSAIAETQSELELAETRRDALRSLTEFVGGTTASGGGAGDLRSQVEELGRAVPAALSTAKQNPPPDPSPVSTAVAATDRKSEPSGILALITDLRSLSRKMRSLDATLQLTDALTRSSRDLRAPLATSLRQLARRGDELASQSESNDPAVLARQKAELDGLTAEFKELSAALLPLGKQAILLDLYKRNLGNWRSAVQSQYAAELRSLILRIAALAVVLAVVLGVSELWRRAIFRYVQDLRRRYQFLLLRRIVLWSVIAIILAFAFSTELGSLATFAGLLTAGVAVALQNVILSIAGYFFLIGKYGVRVGDRVQISGVTGEVVDIGLVRLHVMELSGSGVDSQPTGRVVAFSNSVVFQPTAGLFKQIPGTNFVWHEIKLTLAPQSNFRSVEERLLGAVEAVFAEHREGMERQQRRMARALSPLSVSSLGPRSRLRLTQAGLEVVIRYPLELEKAAELDDRITRELLDAIEREPKLKLVGSGTPNLQPVREPALER